MIEDSKSFCESVEQFSQNNLLQKEDLHWLISIAVSPAKAELFFSMAFTAKYVQGLMRVIQQSTTNPEIKNLQQIKDDLTENMEKISTDLKRYIENEAEDMKHAFEQKYLGMSGEAFMNLRKLLNDLEWVKIYDNHLKRIR